MECAVEEKDLADTEEDSCPWVKTTGWRTRGTSHSKLLQGGSPEDVTETHYQWHPCVNQFSEYTKKDIFSVSPGLEMASEQKQANFLPT